MATYNFMIKLGPLNH